MDCGFDRGFAFILEGDTEKEFYLSLLYFLSKKYSAVLERQKDEENPDIIYTITRGTSISLVKFHVANSVNQVPLSGGNWFNAQCVEYYEKHPWVVFLCYDTDSYKEEITKFYEDDWATLRSKLKKAAKVVDVAAAADIEDIMLQDLDSICNYLNCDIKKVLLNGSKGKKKMKKLFRENDKYYHEGSRARTLIDSLNMQKLIDNDSIPLKDIEDLIFKLN